MNLKSKNGKKVLRNASLIGAGMFILGAGIGVSTSGNTSSSSVQKPRIQKQGIVESSTKSKSASVSTSAVSSKKVASSKLAESGSSKSDTSSSMASSKISSSSETSTDSNSNAQQSDSSSVSMPTTAAVRKTYTVVRGDSLWSISQALHKSFADLLIKNPSTNPDHIEAGEVINL
mgnify:FL=1